MTSFRVIDAPANYVRRRLDEPSGTTTTTTTTTTVASDSVTPGRTVQVAPNNREPQHRQVTAPTKPSPSATPRAPQNTIAEKPKPSPSPAPRSVANPPDAIPHRQGCAGKTWLRVQSIRSEWRLCRREWLHLRQQGEGSLLRQDFPRSVVFSAHQQSPQNRAFIFYELM